MTPIVFIDTETTGVHPRRKVWEIAMIRRDENGEKETVFFVEVDLSADDAGTRLEITQQHIPTYFDAAALTRRWEAALERIASAAN